MKTLLAGASLLPMLILAGAVHAADANTAGASVAVGEVIVTGTRQTGVKAADSAAPIVMVGADALKRVAQPDLITSLEQNLPSFNSEGYGQDTAALVLTADLRGLNPNDTLVLVNGKRRHPTSNLHVDPGPFQGAASADLGLIPIGAIDHIEVLEDGAAAQYGTDAIAGVINIILKKGTAGSLSVTAGQYYEGDGQTGAWSLNKGFDLGGRGFINLTAEERYHGFSQRGSCDSRVSDVPPGCALRTDIPAEDIAGVPLTPGYPFENRIYGDTKSNIYNGMYNAGYDLGGGVELYSFGTFSHRIASAFENYRKPDKVTRIDASGNLVVPFPIGFSPREETREDDFSITGGLKGEAAGWNWDLSTTYGRDKNDIFTINSANASLFADTGFTPTNFHDGSFTGWQWTNNLDIDRAFDVGMATPLNVAFGGEIRKDSFGITAGDPESIYNEGSQSYPGFQPTDAGTHSRTNYAAYVDFAGDPINNLKIDLAGRFEHYTDFGDATSGKLTARYDFSPAFAIRGTVSTGFRAPTLAEEYYSATNVAPTFAVVNLPPNSAAAAAAGFSPLKPEKSDNYSVGFVAHPMDRMQFTADAYEIDIRDRIINTGTLVGAAGVHDRFPGRSQRDRRARQHPRSVGDLRRGGRVHQRRQHPHPRRRGDPDLCLRFRRHGPRRLVGRLQLQRDHPDQAGPVTGDRVQRGVRSDLAGFADVPQLPDHRPAQGKTHTRGLLDPRSRERECARNHLWAVKRDLRAQRRRHRSERDQCAHRHLRNHRPQPGLRLVPQRQARGRGQQSVRQAPAGHPVPAGRWPRRWQQRL